MKHHLLTAAAAAFALTTSPAFSLLELDSTTTINKDGSAKFTQTMNLDLAPVMAMMGEGAPAAPFEADKCREMLVEMIKAMNSSVDVWSEAKIEAKGAAAKITVAGFMKDFRSSGDLKKSLAAAGDKLPIPLADIPDLKMIDMKNDAAGNAVITIVGMDDLASALDTFRKLAVKEGMVPKEGDLSKLERDQIAAVLKQGREQWSGMKPSISPMLEGVSIKGTVITSGSITEASVFKKTADNTATFTFGGAQLITLAESILNDDTMPDRIVALAKTVETEFNNEKSTKAVVEFITPMLKTLLGDSLNPKLVIKPGADAFDYAAETAKAKAEQSPELKALIKEAAATEQKDDKGKDDKDDKDEDFPTEEPAKKAA